MRQPLQAITGAIALSTLALTGCGGSSGVATSPVAGGRVVTLTSSAVASGAVMPRQYTCDGKNVPPPLEWGTVPANTTELLLVVLGFTKAEAGKTTLAIQWAVAGIKPNVKRLASGQLPAGAHVGVASDGKRHYSLCPAKKGQFVKYQFELYGVPKGVKISPNFVSYPVLAALTNPRSGVIATVHGGFVVRYKRQ